MNTYKLILKGILLYTTIIFTALFVCSVDSIKNIDVIFLDVCIIAVLIYACYKTISKEEADILSGNKLFGGKSNDGI